MIRTIDGRGKNTGWIVNSLNRPSQLEAHKEREVVLSVLKSVREEGDAALLRYTREFDRAELAGPEDLCVSKEEIEDAYKKMNSRQLDILEKAARRIRRFHEKQKQESWISFEEKGVLLGQKVTPMERVGVYVPGGKAAYPSSVLIIGFVHNNHSVKTHSNLINIGHRQDAAGWIVGRAYVENFR
jgi:histidinol dehydrogenase